MNKYSDEYLRGFIQTHISFNIRMGIQNNNSGNKSFRVAPYISISCRKEYVDLLDCIRERFNMECKVYKKQTTPLINVYMNKIPEFLSFICDGYCCPVVVGQINMFKDIMYIKQNTDICVDTILEIIKLKEHMNNKYIKRTNRNSTTELLITYRDIIGDIRFSQELKTISPNNEKYFSRVLKHIIKIKG